MARQPSTSHPPNLLLIGRVGKPHGLRGEVKVAPETDEPQRFADLATVFVGASVQQARPCAVESVRFQQGRRGVTVVLKLEGIETPEEAATLRQRLVFAHEADLPPLDDDEFFLHDLVGASVVTEGGEPVGTVTDVLELPAQRVYVVERPGRPPALIPDVPAFLADLNVAERRLVVRPIEGLL